ncbi:MULTISPECIES: transposase family protein [unclassified Clostridium]|uniref:transposase family protein n=1 Tax=Clostridium TaxID=1485 RepID=UPI0013FB4A5C|nr:MULTISPECIES: transposase family protein [unclassified Clostridium]NFI57974.1 transposase family protein [Clostridium botulinum]
MARKSKKLQELQMLFDENDLDFLLINDTRIIQELQDKVEKIPDCRNESYIRHKLSDILMLTNEWSEIEAFGVKKEKWLRQYLTLENGLPSDDTIRIAISNIDSRYFYQAVVELFMDIINKISRLLKADNDTSYSEVISIDGKTSCGSKRNTTDVLGAKNTSYSKCLFK